jgi:hypothetical protein
VSDYVWRVEVKFSADQPRVPAGSPQGGQWTSEGGGTQLMAAGTANIGGMELAEWHKDLIFKLAGSTDAKGVEHGVSIDKDGNATKPVVGKARSIRLRDVEDGDQGNMHTHPSQEHGDYTPPSPRDIELHMKEAWDSNNENFTTIVVSLVEHRPEVLVTTITGWPKGGPRKIERELRNFIVYHSIDKYGTSMPYDGFTERARAATKTYAETVLGLKWEEKLLG